MADRCCLFRLGCKCGWLVAVGAYGPYNASVQFPRPCRFAKWLLINLFSFFLDKKRKKKIKGCRKCPKNLRLGLNPGKLAVRCIRFKVRAGSNSARLFNGPVSNFLDGHFLRPVQREWALGFPLILTSTLTSASAQDNATFVPARTVPGFLTAPSQIF